MTLILEYRDKIQKFYRMNAVVILPVLKFMLAFFALNGVNTMMGYMPRLDTVTVVLVASLACSFLPAGCLTLLCALFSLGHMYALSLEMLLMGACIYLLIFLLLLRFAPSDSYVVILTPLFFALKIPYVIPIAVGLLGSPLSAVSVACGVIIYYVLTTLTGSAPAIAAMDEKEYVEKIKFLLDALLGNKAMLVIAGAFAVTVIVVWLIHRMSVEHAWTIAMVAGAMVNLVILLVGDLKFDIHLSLGSAIFGSLLAILVAKGIEFFRFCVDYGRTEWVQFEDDDYYYYVKAVPKMSVAEPTKTVKKINQAKASSQSSERVREASRPRSSAQGRSATAEVDEEAGQTRAIPVVRNTSHTDAGSMQERSSRQSASGVSRRTADRPTQGMMSGGASFGGNSRTVMTERVPRNSDAAYRKQSSLPQREITVGSNQMSDETEESDGYEELF
ncbi:MAG: hypothetical protein IKQ25_00150 [Lachnospiraceae bacterium]|nr:hypothetical protein [Lachnospiraceae bacterium]